MKSIKPWLVPKIIINIFLYAINCAPIPVAIHLIKIAQQGTYGQFWTYLKLVSLDHSLLFFQQFFFIVPFWNLQHLYFFIGDFTSQNLHNGQKSDFNLHKGFFLMGNNAKQGGFATKFGPSQNQHLGPFYLNPSTTIFSLYPL